jgi:hypothetical protein
MYENIVFVAGFLLYGSIILSIIGKRISETL